MPARPHSESALAALLDSLDNPLALRVVVQLLARALEDCPSDAPRLEDFLAPLAAALKSPLTAVVARKAQGWETVARVGAARSLPHDLLSTVLDQNAAAAAAGFWAGPLEAPEPSNRLLVVQLPVGKAPPQEFPLAQLALTLGAAYAQAQAAAAVRHRSACLRSILDASRRWHQTGELEPLLVHMAEAAQQLLDADRASIFLWDRARKLLIGRPALGVPGGELRIPDDRGVVGATVQSGQPMRVSPDSRPEQIDHDVDKQTGYRTESILCVPLRGSDEQILGAFEAINKRHGNFTDEDEATLTELAAHAGVSLANAQEREALLRSRQEVASEAARQVQIIGRSPPIQALRAALPQVAQSDLSVLLLGENGTGKEVVSRAIHYLSRRRQEPFVAVNCAALSETLLESELFGHEQGAFTDAKQSRAGKFETASGGTLFLDEIGELSRGGQAKLLRVLEDKVVVRVGGERPIATDARVIAATNRHLVEMVRRHEFREDLFYRLNVISLELPPLRQRGEDVWELAEHFLAEFSRKRGRQPPRLSSAAKQRLISHTWPGNVRELRNLVERLVYLLPADEIDARDLSFAVAADGQSPRLVADSLPLSQATDVFQADYIQRTIDRLHGNMTEAAEQLGLHRSNLYRKLRQLGLPTSQP